MTVRLDALFAWFVGATGTDLRSVLAEVKRRPGVYLLDEYDAMVRVRGNAQDVLEMNRMVAAFLEVMDGDAAQSMLIATTEHAEALDRAVARRFELSIGFALPTAVEAEALLRLRLGAFGVSGAPGDFAKELAQRVGACRAATFADVARGCDDALRSMALDGRERVTLTDVEAAFERLLSGGRTGSAGKGRGQRR